MPATPVTDAVEQPKSNGTKPERERPPFVAFASLGAGALLFLIIYGMVADQTTLLVAEVLLGLASLSVGGVLGFLFGIPRSAAGAGVEVKPDAPAAKNDPATGDIRYLPSNNLEQVSDWLTKILIGVGLVQLGEMADGLRRIGEFVAGPVATRPAFASVVTQATVLIFTLIGFLVLFLWTRIYYAGMQALADQEVLAIVRPVIRTLEARVSAQAAVAEKAATAAVELEGLVSSQAATVESTGNVTKLLLSGDLVTPGRAVPADGAPAPQAALAPAATLPEAIRERMSRFLAAPTKWDSDPVAEAFKDYGPEANGRRLESRIVANLDDALVVELRVRGISGSPLDGEVTFLLHPTFPERTLVRAARGGIAKVNIYVAEWFTVGAIADGGATVLTLDLRTLPGAPAWFTKESPAVRDRLFASYSKS